MDAAYSIKLWANKSNSILTVLAQRESVYKLLAQTKPDNLQRNIDAYTIDPVTRYSDLDQSSVKLIDVKKLLDTDNLSLNEETFKSPRLGNFTSTLCIKKNNLNTYKLYFIAKSISEIDQNDATDAAVPSTSDEQVN